MRIGAVANALQTVLLSSRPADTTDPLVKERDDIQRALIVASYLHEAREVIYHDKSHKGRLWELVTEGVRARREHIPLAIVQECQRLLNDDSPLVERLTELRNFLGFHSLPNEFRKWVRRQDPSKMVTLECAPDPNTSDVVFVASAQTVVDSYGDNATTEFLGLAEELARALPYLIEAAIWGVITNHGLEHNRCVVFDLGSVLKTAADSGAPASRS